MNEPPFCPLADSCGYNHIVSESNRLIRLYVLPKIELVATTKREYRIEIEFIDLKRDDDIIVWIMRDKNKKRMREPK